MGHTRMESRVVPRSERSAAGSLWSHFPGCAPSADHAGAERSGKQTVGSREASDAWCCVLALHMGDHVRKRSTLVAPTCGDPLGAMGGKKGNSKSLLGGCLARAVVAPPSQLPKGTLARPSRGGQNRHPGLQPPRRCN